MLDDKENKIIEYLKNNKNKQVYPVDIADFYTWESFQLIQKMKVEGLIE